jgi:hypothetical protein
MLSGGGRVMGALAPCKNSRGDCAKLGDCFGRSVEVGKHAKAVRHPDEMVNNL